MSRRVPSAIAATALVAAVLLGPAAPAAVADHSPSQGRALGAALEPEVAVGVAGAGGSGSGSDAGAAAGGPSGLGIVLILVGLVLCTGGFVVAAVVIRRAGTPRPKAAAGPAGTADPPEPPAGGPAGTTPAA